MNNTEFSGTANKYTPTMYEISFAYLSWEVCGKIRHEGKKPKALKKKFLAFILLCEPLRKFQAL